MLNFLLGFGIGTIFGVLCVVLWALCAANKKHDDDFDL